MKSWQLSMGKLPGDVLPNGWVECSVGEITLPVEKIDQKCELDKEIDYVDISSIDNSCNKIGETKRFCLRNAPSRARQIVHAGDVLFSTVRPYLRNIAFVPSRLDGQIASTGFSVLRPGTGFEPDFLFYKAISSEFVNTLSGKQYGVSYPAVKDEQVRAQTLVLPPTSEQQRIVAKIEQLFSELDKGIESLKTARKQLKVYRQALLKQAFEGKLTEQWRKDNADKLETADQLLERNQQEREVCYQLQLDEWNVAVIHWEACSKEGKKPTKPREPKVLSELDSEELVVLPVLPPSWYWDKLGWMTLGVGYGTSEKSSKEGVCPVLRMGNIQNAKFDWDDLVYTSGKGEIEKYLLKKGDVLFNRTNSPELVGKTAIYVEDKLAIFAGYLIRINHFHSIVDSQYLNLFLNSYVAKQHGNTVKTDGVNQSNINGDKLSNYPFPFCLLLEQREVVRVLDEKLSVVDEAAKEVEQNLLRSEALRQSILKKAFSGELVPQEPDDEPASELMKRIAAEKAEIEARAKAAKAAVKKPMKKSRAGSR